jgi:hypothetical protein
MTERLFRGFSDLLYRQQGLFLKRLSQAVEPATMALVSGKLASENLFPIENTDARLLERLPKGSSKVFEVLTRPVSSISY